MDFHRNICYTYRLLYNFLCITKRKPLWTKSNKNIFYKQKLPLNIYDSCAKIAKEIFRIKPNNPHSPSTRVILVFNMFPKKGLWKVHWLCGYWIGLWQLKKNIKILTPVCYTYEIIFFVIQCLVIQGDFQNHWLYLSLLNGHYMYRINHAYSPPPLTIFSCKKGGGN